MNIDPLYFLLLAELALVLLVLLVYFFISNGKNKELYQKTLRKLNDLKSEMSPESFDRPVSDSDEASFPAPPEDVLERQEPMRAAASSEAVESFESGRPDQPDDGGTEEEEAGEGVVRRLQRMVNFQKSTIVELMCYKDVFEGARNRLASLQRSNDELQEKIRGLINGGVESPELEESVTVLEKNNREMEKFISVLDSENARLSEKFQAWEDEFKRIAEDVEESPDSGPDDAKYAEMLNEKEAMVTRIKDFEEKLEEKSQILSSMQAQYEDLEKEYMILYRQQQQQQAAAQPE